jgi:threonine/homoserine/homoserine lactone efflux protein
VTTSSVLTFALAALVVIVVPGPSVLFTIGRALSVGRRDAVLSVVGNGLGVLAQVILIAVGLGALVAASATAYTAVKLAGAAYLVWLGVKAIRHRRDTAVALRAGVSGLPGARLPVLRTGFVVGVTNPKTVVFLSALLPQFVDRSGVASLQMLALGALFAAMAVALDSCWALAAGQVRDWFASSPRRLERIGGAGGAMMIGLGAGVAVSGRPE